MTIHTAVVGHISRQVQAEALADSLSATLFLDRLTLGSTWNHLRALNWGAAKSGHLIVLEDDAEPVAGFAGLAAAFITEHPRDLVSFYLGTDSRRHQRLVPAWLAEADAAAHDFISHPGLLHAVAYAIPCDRITTLRLTTRHAADEMITQGWADGRQRRPVLYTVPSYVEHADGASVENRRTQPRKAWRLHASVQRPRVPHNLPSQ